MVIAEKKYEDFARETARQMQGGGGGMHACWQYDAPAVTVASISVNDRHGASSARSYRKLLSSPTNRTD
jgi:hypothetical protein